MKILHSYQKISTLIIVLIALSSCTYQMTLEKSSQSEIIEETNSGNTTIDNQKVFSGSTKDNTIGYSGNDYTGLGLKVSDNFSISTFVDGVSGARDITGPDALGNFLLSRTKEGIITLLEVTDGNVTNTTNILIGLNNPHGLALSDDGMDLYYAETDKISKIRLYSDSSPEKLVDLPEGGRHYTRSLIWGPEEKLYVSIGSTCDTCYEQDERIASIYRLNSDGSNFEQVVTGLRNSVFIARNPISGEIWATEMGRDNLGNNTPPDEINIIQPGNDYGWPLCYGQNIHDSVFDNNTYISDPCTNKTAAHIELQAHSAPLGISFILEEGWPEEYGNDILVAYHGSWNKTPPTGYKIMHIALDDNGNEISRRNFISGWIDSNENVSGRPVDILTFPGGIAYITDDKKGVVYKVIYNNEE